MKLKNRHCWRVRRAPSQSSTWATTYKCRSKAGCLPRSRVGELLYHGQEQLAVALVQIGGVAADLVEKAQLLVGELLQVWLAAHRVVGEELGDGQVEGSRNLRQCVQRGHRMAVLHAREIASQQAGLLFYVSLGKPFLQAESADGGADLQHGNVLFRCRRGYSRGSNR